MAKFGRFDPRNKKRDRNKNISQTKDNRIRDVEESRTGFKIQGHNIDYAMYDGQDEFENDNESQLMNKIILTDCDGVLLNWEGAFTDWMTSRGYVVDENNRREYNMGKRYGISSEEKDRTVRAFN